MIGINIPLGNTIALIRVLPGPDSFPRQILRCYVHTAAATKATPQGIHRYHTQNKGWADIGYHFLIAKDGTITAGRPIEDRGAGVRGDNNHSVHVCMLGHGDRERWTKEQLTAFMDLAHDFWAVYEIRACDFYGHREYKGTRKTCPGKLIDMAIIRTLIRERLESVMDEDWDGEYPSEDLLA